MSKKGRVKPGKVCMTARVERVGGHGATANRSRTGRIYRTHLKAFVLWVPELSATASADAFEQLPFPETTA